MKEVWKDIFGYVGFYQVSSFGRVRSVSRMVNHSRGGKMSWKGRILKPGISPRGYYYCVFSKFGKVGNVFVHKAVAKAFIPNPENKIQVNHLDFVKTSCVLHNLEWATPRENYDHALVNGRFARKLTPSLVRLIRWDVAGGGTNVSVAKKYSISQGTVGKIRLRQLWKHVK